MTREVKNASEVVRALKARGLDVEGLSPIGVRPTLFTYVRQLWERRHFIWFDSRQRAANQNAGNRLGNVWLFLKPLVDAAFYFVIFGVVLSGARGGIENFAAFVIIGILMFRSTSSAISGGAGTLRGARSMIRAFSFPRATIPISNMLQTAMTTVITMAIMCLAIIAIPPHVAPSLTWLWVIPIFLLQTALNLGITFFAARIGFHVPDMANVLSVVSRFLMYGSGVIFPIERFISNETALEIVTLNPLYRIIDMARTALMDGQVPDLESWLIVLAWTAVLLIGGFIFFWRGEASYGREVR